MLSLFNKYKEQSFYDKALIVGRNMVNRFPGNLEYLAAYLDLLLMLVRNLPKLEERKGFLEQAVTTLAFFEENADLNEELIATILEYHSTIDNLSAELDSLEARAYADYEAAVVSENQKAIALLMEVKQTLSNVKTKKVFDEILQELKRVDGSIQHDYLTEDQTAVYEQLNRDCSEIMSKKMREFEYKDNVSYNESAVKAYAEAFRQFRADEGKYKEQSALFSLVSRTLFAYDASRLFNETLVYYNHVYSYVFSKLDDDGKLALTRFSVQCERK